MYSKANVPLISCNPLLLVMTELEGFGWVAVGFAATLAGLEIGWRLARRRRIPILGQNEVASVI